MISQPFNNHNSVSKAFIALGANDPDDIRLLSLRLKTCIQDIGTHEIVIRRVSRFFRTPCFPVGAGPDFVNAVAEVDSHLPPDQLLAHLHAVEHKHARTRDHRWGPRTMDVDLLSFDDQVLPDRETHVHWRDLPLSEQQTRAPEQLILPHPRLQDRGFVLVPWADLAPDWCHPITGLTVQQMLLALDPTELRQIVPLTDPDPG